MVTLTTQALGKNDVEAKQSMVVANTILDQLGGRRFVAMTGARSFLAGSSYLGFRLPRSKDGANYVKITLTPMDVYTFETFSVRAGKLTPKTTREDVYADSLREVFEHVTGLYTRLG